MLGRWKPKGIRKIQIQCHNSTSVFLTAGRYLFIGCRAKSLCRNRADIVACGHQQIPTSNPEIFIELEFHATGSNAKGTNRSWDMAAPYAMQA